MRVEARCLSKVRAGYPPPTWHWEIVPAKTGIDFVTIKIVLPMSFKFAQVSQREIDLPGLRRCRDLFSLQLGT